MVGFLLKGKDTGEKLFNWDGVGLRDAVRRGGSGFSGRKRNDLRSRLSGGVSRPRFFEQG